MCAYAHHAEALGYTSPKVYAFVAEALSFLSSPKSKEVPEVLAMAMRVGECNYTVMEMLSNAHSNTFGHPTPTSVDLAPKPGKAILITGHDMHGEWLPIVGMWHLWLWTCLDRAATPCVFGNSCDLACALFPHCV